MARLAPRLRSHLHRALDRIGVTGNHCLIRRIQIRGRANFAFRGALADIGDHGGRKPHDRGHRTFTGGHRFLHIFAALVHHFDGIGKFQRASGNQRGIFAQAMTRDKIGSNAFFFQHAIRRHRAASESRAECWRSASVLLRNPRNTSAKCENPSALSASSKTAFADGYASASSLPMPGYCEACPGNTNATLPIFFPVFLSV